MVATAIENAYIPSAMLNIEGRYWLLFHNDGTFESFRRMPNALRYDGKVFIKAGWNSDTHSVHYKQGQPAVAC